MFRGSFNRRHKLKCTPVLLAEIRRTTYYKLDLTSEATKRDGFQTKRTILLQSRFPRSFLKTLHVLLKTLNVLQYQFLDAFVQLHVQAAE